ncbi:MAG: hypothetical protein EHM24_26365, partial [Acidobacteria bacterium]
METQTTVRPATLQELQARVAYVEQVKEITAYGFLNWIQLHGDETPEFCDTLNWFHVRTIKAIRVQSAADIKRMEGYHTDAILLDAFNS